MYLASSASTIPAPIPPVTHRNPHQKGIHLQISLAYNKIGVEISLGKSKSGKQKRSFNVCTF